MVLGVEAFFIECGGGAGTGWECCSGGRGECQLAAVRLCAGGVASDSDRDEPDGRVCGPPSRGGQAKFPAPHKVLARGLLTEKEVLAGCITTFAIGIGMGLYIVTEVGWPILAVGLGSVFVAVFYSAGPKPLGDTGLGEATVFFFMGPLMVVAAYYVQTQELAWAPFWASMPVAFLVTAILHCNNLRDVDEDRENGKRTFVTMLGPGVGRVIYVGFLLASYGSIVIVAVTGVVSIWGWWRWCRWRGHTWRLEVF